MYETSYVTDRRASLRYYGVTNEKAIDILQTEDTEWEVKAFM